MKTFYSATTHGFYPEDMRPDYEAAGTWPSDAVEVSQDEAAALRLAMQPSPPTYCEQRDAYLASVRATREMILNRLAGIGLSAMFSGDTATSGAVQSARAALLGLPDNPGVVAASDLDTLKAAVLSVYREIVSAAPATLKKSFDGVSA